MFFLDNNLATSYKTFWLSFTEYYALMKTVHKWFYIYITLTMPKCANVTTTMTDNATGEYEGSC